jgi:hypothetical protein
LFGTGSAELLSFPGRRFGRKDAGLSANFWVGVVVIVCVLEFVRIALSAYVLVHILESRAMAVGRGNALSARQSLEARDRYRRRETLAEPTLNALRSAMDELNHGRPGTGVRAAIVALDAYIGASSEHVTR